jgi:hypothetical protein
VVPHRGQFPEKEGEAVEAGPDTRSNRGEFDMDDDTAEIIKAIEEELGIDKRKEYAELETKFVNFSPGVPFHQFSQFVEEVNNTREKVHLRTTERRNRTKTVHVLMIHNYQKIESEPEEKATSD